MRCKTLKSSPCMRLRAGDIGDQRDLFKIVLLHRKAQRLATRRQRTICRHKQLTLQGLFSVELDRDRLLFTGNIHHSAWHKLLDGRTLSHALGVNAPHIRQFNHIT
ncbi:Uncharacterised protein [Vibrio cholerae]|nr:Uncharacterised protein [Vibrio cholerae]CSC46438.1 Uncharacterised protein [Vibrio cholerae]